MKIIFFNVHIFKLYKSDIQSDFFSKIKSLDYFKDQFVLLLLLL